MRKSFVTVLIIIGTAASLKAQTIEPSVLAPAGGSAQTSTISLDWTLGEYAVETIFTEAKMYTQGFNQPFLIVTPSATVTADKSAYKISIAPNPVYSILNFNISSSKDILVFISITDIQGKSLIQRNVRSASGYLQIDFKGLPPGTYILTAREAASGRIIKSYQIIRL